MEATTKAQIISGKEVSSRLRGELKQEVSSFRETTGVTPGLAVVLVGDDPASRVYVRNKARGCEEVGIRSFQHTLPEDVSEGELLALVGELNNNDEVHGILVQMPLPPHIDEETVIEGISPGKDVDGFHPYNVGRLMIGMPLLQSCTPLGIMKLIDSTGIDLTGKEAVVVGRSNIVGKPMAMMLLRRNATVTVCHSRTSDLPGRVLAADIVVAAVGRAGFVKGEWIKEGAVVIDVGINRTEEGKLVGDVDFEGASKRASYITPVPGGVGPMTIAMLLSNTLDAAKKSVGA
jgi:methylenetetrahydrofolate dehydrogenase (NADP+)/methenyltetrahydrofolate cyclohydrolase